MPAFYNELEPYAAQWLRNLSDAGHIAPGTVDERSIKDLNPSDLAGHQQCHFFAGIGVWSYALRLAGIPDEFPVWTGSCPCQPFSGAGKGLGFADPRHLWPVWFELIKQCRPPVIFGEQVASKDGLAWLDLVSTDLEGEGYTFWAADLCAAGIGAPHIRQRLYWVAYSNQLSFGRNCGTAPGTQAPFVGENGSNNRTDGHGAQSACGISGSVALADSNRGQCYGFTSSEGRECNGSAPRRQQGNGESECCCQIGAGPVNGFWGNAEWLPCLDGFARPVEPGTFPLAHGVARRVGKIRAYGNAIVAPLAATFIRAAIEAIAEQTQ